MVFSPLHSTNRLPLGDDDFPVELPVYPDAKEILPSHSNPYEGGIHGTYSLGFGDISLSYFSGYDRTFNLSGVNVYGRGSDISFPYVDIVYGYRKTNVLGLGGVILSDWFTLGLMLVIFLLKTIIKQSTDQVHSTLHFMILSISHILFMKKQSTSKPPYK